MHVPEGYYQAILQAIPLPLLLVDENLQIHELNNAAAKTFGLTAEVVLKQRGGDILRCLHAFETPEGCGTAPSCSDCVIRNSVISCLSGQSIYRRRMKFNTVGTETSRDFELLVTAAPLPAQAGDLALLVLEDITELSMLKNIIPICMHCKRVRDDRQFWQQVEGYFHDFIGVEFSHGVCPDCMRQHYPEMRR